MRPLIFLESTIPPTFISVKASTGVSCRRVDDLPRTNFADQGPEIFWSSDLGSFFPVTITIPIRSARGIFRSFVSKVKGGDTYLQWRFGHPSPAWHNLWRSKEGSSTLEEQWRDCEEEKFVSRLSKWLCSFDGTDGDVLDSEHLENRDPNFCGQHVNDLRDFTCDLLVWKAATLHVMLLSAESALEHDPELLSPEELQTLRTMISEETRKYEDFVRAHSRPLPRGASYVRRTEVKDLLNSVPVITALPGGGYTLEREPLDKEHERWESKIASGSPDAVAAAAARRDLITFPEEGSTKLPLSWERRDPENLSQPLQDPHTGMYQR